jgi:hypothetical protein
MKLKLIAQRLLPCLLRVLKAVLKAYIQRSNDPHLSPVVCLLILFIYLLLTCYDRVKKDHAMLAPFTAGSQTTNSPPLVIERSEVLYSVLHIQIAHYFGLFLLEHRTSVHHIQTDNV